MSTTTFPTGTWHLSPSTTITVTVKKLGVITVPATLDLVSGTIEVDGDHQITNVEVIADAASYSSKNAKRNEHVHGADFLDVENHPTIVFRTSAVTPSANGYQANGTVTIKGQTSAVEVAIDNVEFTDAEGSFAASATIDRKKIGVDKLPTFIVGGNLLLSVSATAALAS